MEANPKKYERERLSDSEIRYPDKAFRKETSSAILSVPYKRRLKKGFMPYWHRPLDFWLWQEYYDQLLQLFNMSFDSFGNISPMLLFRFHYLQRHVSSELKFYQSSTEIILLELLRSEIINQKDIEGLKTLEENVQARVSVMTKVEKKLQIFIYEKDLNTLSHDPKAFESFLLSLCGQQIILKNIRTLPTWAQEGNFVSPHFKENES